VLFKGVEKSQLFALLEEEVSKRDSATELTPDKPDPLLVAKKFEDTYIALICALFGYGNAAQIVKFLNSLDFSLLDEEEDKIRQALRYHYYRFQKSEDVTALFITLRRLKQESAMEEIFLEGYKKEGSVLEGISTVILKMKSLYPYESRGYHFLLGAPYHKGVKSPYKRWNMFLRWMVRKDSLDMGLWKHVLRADLLIPLDTHTFQVSRKLGLLKRKTYDLKAVLELTERLKEFDRNDPVKYDFALYRLGQERVLAHLK
jgi:uncharacterized protein (TIGR02757 family)